MIIYVNGIHYILEEELKQVCSPTFTLNDSVVRKEDVIRESLGWNRLDLGVYPPSHLSFILSHAKAYDRLDIERATIDILNLINELTYELGVDFEVLFEKNKELMLQNKRS